MTAPPREVIREYQSDQPSRAARRPSRGGLSVLDRPCTYCTHGPAPPIDRSLHIRGEIHLARRPPVFRNGPIGPRPHACHTPFPHGPHASFTNVVTVSLAEPTRPTTDGAGRVSASAPVASGRGPHRVWSLVGGYMPTRRLAWAIMVSAPVSRLLAAVHGVPPVVGAIVVGLLVGGAALDANALPSRRRVELVRAFPPGLGVGNTTAGTYGITVRWPWPRQFRGLLYDALPRGVRRTTPTPQSFVVTHGSVETIRAEIVGRERGEWRLGVVAVRLAGPLGLVMRTYRWDPGDQILVSPSIAGLRKYRLLTMQHRLREVGVRVLRRRGEGTNFAGLREYVVGDDPRVIDWKASARRPALISREFSVEQGQTVMIVIDCGQSMTRAGGRPAAVRVRVVVGAGVGRRRVRGRVTPWGSWHSTTKSGHGWRRRGVAEPCRRSARR